MDKKKRENMTLKTAESIASSSGKGNSRLPDYAGRGKIKRNAKMKNKKFYKWKIERALKKTGIGGGIEFFTDTINTNSFHKMKESKRNYNCLDNKIEVLSYKVIERKEQNG